MFSFLSVMTFDLVLLFWLAIFVTAIVIEIQTANLVSFWFAIGAFIAGVSSVFGLPFYGQAIVFVVTSIVALVISKYFLNKFDKKHANPPLYNYIGYTFVLAADIDQFTSTTVNINGVVWDIASNIAISKGETVIVSQLIGNKLLVSKKEVN